jgi:RNA polymerase sigma-70 factor (ECF subfamily)
MIRPMPFVLPFVPRSRSGLGTGSLAASDALAALESPDLVALRSGDAQAIGPIYARESARVYRYAHALCGNPAWAADATQEAFVALALRPQAFDASKGPLGAYLAGVARHALTRMWRLERKQQSLTSPEDPNHELLGDECAASATSASPETLMEQAQDGAAVWAALRQLPAIFREAVILVDLQERPYAEAAAIAGIELNTLRTRLHRARIRLATLLGAEQERTP